MSSKPRPQDYPTAWSFWQARRQWVKQHGGAMVWPFVIAIIFGVLSGSAIGFIALLVFTVIAVAYARSRR